MTDIVERLQKATLYEGNGELSALPEEAADEIAALRAKNERLRVALTPSAETKAAYIGEFHITEEGYDEDGQVYYRKVAVPWTIIKEIMAAISARAALTQPTGE